MRTILICYNSLTFIRSVYYIDTVFGKNDSLILFYDGYSITNQISEFSNHGYQIAFIYPKKNYISKKCNNSFVNTILEKKSISKEIKSKASSFLGEDECNIVIFKDNHYVEVDLIENIYYRLKKRANIILIEEGVGLYNFDKYLEPLRHPVFQRINGLPKYCLNNPVQGMNPKVDEIWCTNPELIKLKRKDMSTRVRKINGVFPVDFCNYYIDVVGLRDIVRSYDFQTIRYVYLTQPYKGYKYFNSELDYINRLKDVLSVLELYGRVFIKPHPKDDVDYSQLITDNICVCDMDTQKIPFEIISSLFLKYQIVTVTSSVSINDKSGYDPIFVYPMFLPDNGKEYETYYKTCSKNGRICQDIHQLEAAVRSTL